MPADRPRPTVVLAKRTKTSAIHAGERLTMSEAAKA